MYFLIDGCVIVFFFCLNKFKVFDILKDFEDVKWLSIFEFEDGLVLNIFECIKDNDIVGLFIEDREIIDNIDGKRVVYRWGWLLVFIIIILFFMEIFIK